MPGGGGGREAYMELIRLLCNYSLSSVWRVRSACAMYSPLSDLPVVVLFFLRLLSLQPSLSM